MTSDAVGHRCQPEKQPERVPVKIFKQCLDSEGSSASRKKEEVIGVNREEEDT